MKNFIMCTIASLLLASANTSIVKESKENTLQNEVRHHSDGMSEVKTHQEKSHQKKVFPAPSPLIEKGNFIKNGNFNFPQISSQFEIVNAVPLWSSDEIERGRGNYYNSNWGNNVVVELDGTDNDIIKQTLTLEEGNYLLSFQWAARTQYEFTSAMSIYWSGQKIFEVSAPDSSIHSQQIPISVPDSGNYVLQIRGEGISDSYGMTVANFKLKKAEKNLN